MDSFHTIFLRFLQNLVIKVVINKEKWRIAKLPFDPVRNFYALTTWQCARSLDFLAKSNLNIFNPKVSSTRYENFSPVKNSLAYTLLVSIKFNELITSEMLTESCESYACLLRFVENESFQHPQNMQLINLSSPLYMTHIM